MKERVLPFQFSRAEEVDDVVAELVDGEYCVVDAVSKFRNSFMLSYRIERRRKRVFWKEGINSGDTCTWNEGQSTLFRNHRAMFLGRSTRGGMNVDAMLSCTLTECGCMPKKVKAKRETRRHIKGEGVFTEEPLDTKGEEWLELFKDTFTDTPYSVMKPLAQHLAKNRINPETFASVLYTIQKRVPESGLRWQFSQVEAILTRNTKRIDPRLR